MLFAFAERLRQLRYERNYTMSMVADRLPKRIYLLGNLHRESMRRDKPIQTWKRLRL